MTKTGIRMAVRRAGIRGRLRKMRRGKRQASGLVVALVVLATRVAVASSEPSPNPSSITTAPLTVDQVVDNLVRRNQERAQALRHSEAKRTYHLVYQGFPGDREAEMTVEASYDSPSTKDFKVVSQTGSKLILERVFKKLLESEREAAQPEMQGRTLLNHDNYDFTLVGYESSNSGGVYVLEVTPKSKSKYVYRGKIWVDGTDFAVTQIDAEPARNPSFWTKKNEIHHSYAKIQGFWLPQRNESVSYIRLGGRATLTIDYADYRVIDARTTQSTVRPTRATQPRRKMLSPASEAVFLPNASMADLQ